MLDTHNYLLIRLYGNLASWGEIAVGESRHSATHPSKSALLGLIGAALGIKREQEDELQAIALGYHFAIKQQNVGFIMRDYHTTQVPDAVGKFTYRTRRDEIVLGAERLGTNLSSREYRTDSVNIVAIKALADAPYTLAQIQAKLLKPEFHLYLGRKSCPLAAPLDPQPIVAADYYSAFELYKEKPMSANSPGQYDLKPDAVNRYYWQGDTTDFVVNGDWFKPEQVQTLTRHDQPTSRQRWQFSQRLEHFYQHKTKELQ